MKRTLIFCSLMLLLFNAAAKANEYCYDFGDFALIRLENALLTCQGKEGTNTSIRVIRKLGNRISTPIPFFYSTRALKGLESLDSYMENLEKDECNSKVQEMYLKEVRPTVVRTINLCKI